MWFLVLTVFLGLGRVGSSVFWAFDPGSQPPPEASEVQQEMPLEERIADLETRLKEDTRNIQLMKQLASLYWEAGRGEEALETYRRALEIDPGAIDVRRDLALTHYLLGNYDDAVKQIEEVLKQDPQNADAYYYLGQFCAYRSDEGRDVPRGIEMLEKFIEMRGEGLEVEKARQMIDELKNSGTK